jgi:hypothetical protein
MRDDVTAQKSSAVPFHRKERFPVGSGSRVEDLRDVRVVEEASAWRSASNRASTSLVSIPTLITFRATRRTIGSRCSTV